ncbi:Ankyrin repeat-containing domain protein [Rutstroemia sp. NJR-2017a BBW]|nr:Ankyrin repeat-containing domain protein [Rutstroemia sp. NJR-2017a BBW]
MNSAPDGEEDLLPIHIAVSNRDTTELKALLSQSHDSINTRDPWNYTPLQIAVEANDLPAVHLLISSGADSDLEVPNHYSDLVEGTNSLSSAAQSGHLEVLRFLVENSGRLTTKSLYMAAEAGRLDCVAFILSYVDKAEKTVFGDGVSKNEAVGEALRIAAAGWRDEIVEVILHNREIETRLMGTALLWLIHDEEEFDDYHVINPVPRKTPEGKKKRIKIAKLLLDAGADVNARGEMHGIEGMTPLHKTSRMGSRIREIFDMLLEKKPNVNAEDEDEQTPLFQAILADDVYFAEMLIDNGARVEQIDKQGHTVLHISTDNLTPACKHIVKCLLDYGADISAVTKQGESPLHLAAYQGNAAAMEVLLSHSDSKLLGVRSATGFTALHSAAHGPAQTNIDVVALLLAQGMDINERTDSGLTLLHLAATSFSPDKIDFVELLLEKGADVNGWTIPVVLGDSTPQAHERSLPTKQANGVIDTPLHLALDREPVDFGLVSVLLDGGANIEARDSIGRTALLRCVVGYEVALPRQEVALELIKRGANIEAVDDLGRKIDVDAWSVMPGWGQ